MVFLRKTKTASGATAVQIAERKNRRDVVLEHLGSAHTEPELAALMSAGRDKINAAQEALDLGLPRDPQSAVVYSKRSRQLVETLQVAWTALGFDVIKNEAFFQLVAARLTEPTSMSDSARVLTEVGMDPVHRSTMKRCLARVAEREYRDHIATKCFEHAATSGDISLVLYDVTTLYFEAEHEDELRKVGYSKERRVDPQIVVGLLVDRGGFPLEIGCFEGNHAETRTIVPIIKQFQTRHNLADMVGVADAGMLSTANLTALDEAELKFIVSSRQVKAPGDLANHFHWNGHCVHRWAVDRHDHPAPRQHQDRAEEEPAGAGLGPRAASRALAGRLGLLPQTRSPGRTHTHCAGEPGPGRDRRGRGGEVDPVREDHCGRSHPRRSLSRASSAPGRIEGLRHQHPRPGHAAGRGALELSRPLARRAVLPDE
ncbi:hypothetical protein FHX50_000351 [Helcobacillus massiliensis]|uniref:IS1634 family transposase n=1 Tax=Helcobacillus massiliensis TaxID=521392 RepID=A0A839QNP4_9MICO|nr:hypothetical protein [Helcobacillus massiliensis]